jgi:hypothetical protein
MRTSIILALTILAGCPADEDAAPDAPPVVPDAAAAASTHTGILSIQDVVLAVAPQLGPGLTVTGVFSRVARPADVDQVPGELFGGCRAWLYDVDTDPPPAIADEGRITIAGMNEPVPDGCTFGPAGYLCPILTGTAVDAAVTPMSGPAMYQLPGATFTADVAGRYLEIRGAAQPGNVGRFPIIAVPAPTTLIVGNPAAIAETAIGAQFTVVAGAGPVPNNPRDPIEEDDVVTVGIEPRAGGHFDFPDATIEAGGAFTPDDATLALLRDFPVDGDAVTLRCDGPGGQCGDADATLALIRTSDGDITGLPPFALPPPRRKQVEILCAVDGADGALPIPGEATALIAAAHAASPITRIRVAYMREGVAFVTNALPAPPNATVIAVGHGHVGFTDVAP